MAKQYDIIVIGAGAAGMTAALYALRNGKTVLVLEEETIGGQIATSPRVENFPTHVEIAGTDFANEMFEQITHHGADFELEKVEKVTKNGDLFSVVTDYGAGNMDYAIRGGTDLSLNSGNPTNNNPTATQVY